MNLPEPPDLGKISAILLPAFAPCLLFGATGTPPAPEAKALREGVSIEMIAEHPAVVTPIGLDVDRQGQIWLVASHTHETPKGYSGPDRDEVLVFNPDGERIVFRSQTIHTMDLELGRDGWVYLAERDRILRLRDSDGDGRADEEETVVKLESEESYPHNGMSGLAWHPDGDLIFGLGENFAKPWSLTGSDGSTHAGRAEGGIFRCSADGSRLRWIARGLWNPFGICVREDGEIFAVDNDPGERPPCRLLHVVEGGDYGYRRHYGGEAHHPFVGWNGELRATLPMINPSGEAPCAVLPLGRGVLIPSWGDHRIDFFRLRSRGASYEAEARIPLVQGSLFFRPTCLAQDPSGKDPDKRTWYLTDWVDGRYPVHGLGRLWKLEIDLAKADWLGPLDLEKPTQEALLARDIRTRAGKLSEDELFTLAGHEDAFIARSALVRLADEAAPRWTPGDFSRLSPERRILSVLALSSSEADPAPWVETLLRDPDAVVNFEGLRWFSHRETREALTAVKRFLSRSDLDFAAFEAAVAAHNTLSGIPEQGVRNHDLLLDRIRDKNSAPSLRAFALRLLPSQDWRPRESGPSGRVSFPAELTSDLMLELLSEGNGDLSREVVLALSDNPEAGTDLLAQVAADTAADPALRALAVAGLASVPEQSPLLLQLAGDDHRELREESLRALRHRSLTDREKEILKALRPRVPESDDLFAAVLTPEILFQNRPPATDTAAWKKRLDAVPGEPDPAAGSRVFHHPTVALCANCHRHEGRGRSIGPDLGGIEAGEVRDGLIESILQPSRKIAPEYLPRAVTLKDGRTIVGIRMQSYTRERVKDVNGHSLTFELEELDSIAELDTSLMPAGLALSLTDRELRDLVAFLMTPEDAK
jgi:putative membrane-bound dehydrogenase-like protein